MAAPDLEADVDSIEAAACFGDAAAGGKVNGVSMPTDAGAVRLPPTRPASCDLVDVVQLAFEVVDEVLARQWCAGRPFA